MEMVKFCAQLGVALALIMGIPTVVIMGIAALFGGCS